MSPYLAETLKELKRIQWQSSGGNMSHVVFTYKGKRFSSYVFGKAINKCLEMAGIYPIRIHDLRDSYATIRLLKGHNIGDVSYQLGHASINITYDCYTIWMPGKFKREVDDLDHIEDIQKTLKKESTG